MTRERFFSTTQFGPGHLFGGALFVVGTIGLVKWAKRRKAQAESDRSLALSPIPPRGHYR